MSSGASTKEINVTPLIDVMLVLLIIFLVLTPVVLRVERVSIPPKLADDSIVEGKPPVVLKMHADLTISIDEGPAVQPAELLGEIRTKARASKAVFVDFEDGVPWNEVVGMVDRFKANERR